MSEKEPLRAGYITLEDQEFLKELGISGMESGAETILRQSQEAKEAMSRIEERAAGLQALELDDMTLLKLSREQGKPISQIREEMQFFRDADNRKQKGN